MTSIPPHESGVYLIRCQTTQKVYIGSSVNIARRWTEHRKQLRGNRHHSPHLQNAWNTYGEEAFAVEVVELCPPEILKEREQYYLDTIRPYIPTIGFNIGSVADAAMTGRTFSPKAIERIREATRRRGPVSEITRQRMREAQARRGKDVFDKLSKALTGKKLSQETREKIRLANKQRGPISEETRERLRNDPIRRAPRTEETKQRMSQAQKGRKVSQETRDKQAAKLRGRQLTPEQKLRQSEGLKRMWAERRAKKSQD